jgi:hypothetical protein
MAPLPPLQSLGFGTSRWRLQANATLGLRAGERGHHLFSRRTSVRSRHEADLAINRVRVIRLDRF